METAEAVEPRPARSPAEEATNAAIHGVAALGAVAATVILCLDAAGHALAVVSVAVFGASMLLLFTASTLYHALAGTRPARVLRALDHVSIYVLIAGTYTPFTLLCLGGGRGWSIFGFVWGLAAIGTTLRLVFGRRRGGLAVALYLAMGWFGIFTIEEIHAALGPKAFAWLVSGGLTYTVGVAFYAMKRRRWMHAIWHLFVVGGAALHCWALHLYLIR